MMGSTFSWLDLSDRERRRVLDALDKFQERDTRDELGLASLRDGFADRFFPGTSVVQTRARYFLFVPWIYQRLEAKARTSESVAHEARRAEIKLIEGLLSGGETTGVIGRQARDALVRLPSNIYWLGLRSWGVCTFDGLQEDYHRHFSALLTRSSTARDDDGAPLDRARRTWHPDIPAPPAEFPEKPSFKLTREEAEFLQGRIVETTAGSVLHVLARKWTDVEDASFLWAHPSVNELPVDLRSAVQHAKCFAMTAQGAVMLYVLLLEEKRQALGSGADLVGPVREALRVWAEELRADPDIGRWDRTAFWGEVARTANVSGSTRSFVNQWLDLAPWTRDDGGADLEIARVLISTREKQLKGPRARLHNPRALELWGGATGALRMDYRWRTGQSYLRDIHQALGADHA